MPPPQAYSLKHRSIAKVPRHISLLLSNLKQLAALATIILGLISTALLVSQSLSTEADGRVAISYLSDPGEKLSKEEVADKFFFGSRKIKPSRGLTPDGFFWISLSISVEGSAPPLAVELRQLRGENSTFWTAVVTPSGERSFKELPALKTGSGIAFENLSAQDGKVLIFGHLKGESIVKPQIVLQENSNLQTHLIDSNRLGGLLFGGMLGLSAFGAIVSLLNKDKTFFLLSALLITSLRIAGFNYGWDIHWIGWPVNPTYIPAIKNLTLILHMVLTAALFQELFKKQLNSPLQKVFFNYLYLFYAATTCLSFVIPGHTSIALIWALGLVTTLSIFHHLVSILKTDASAVAIWYALSWFVTGIGTLGEISNTLGYSGFATKILNSQIAAVSSAVLSGVALAAKLRIEKQTRIIAQNSAINALQRLRDNYNAMPIGLFSMQGDGTILEYNPAFGVMFNLPPPSRYREIKNWVEISGKSAAEFLTKQTDDNRITDTEIFISENNRERRWLHIRALKKQGRIEAWIEDITARKEAEGRLKFLADHDSLTGLLNRRGLDSHLEQAVAASGDEDTCFAYIDLDRFKLVNDLFGHLAGDQILREMSTRTRAVIQPPHTIARIGGDEFVIIIRKLPLHSAKILCTELCLALSEKPYYHQDKAFSVAASIGVIQLTPRMDARDALTASDRACSEAKKSGGSTVVSLDSHSSQLISYLDEIKLVANMKERLPIENFFTQLQPIVALRTPYSNLSYEVLVRMRDGDGKVVAPGRFISAAERNGLMSQIDRWVLRTTLEWLDSHLAHRERLNFCTVNLSGASLNDEKFLQDTIALIREHPDATQRICFEITESVALYDLNTTRRFVDRVKSFGARIALDDFGAGYTSFNYLKELPGDFVKIDGSFIRDVNLNPANHAITRAIVELSHEIGMACVAEWAENSEIVQTLIDLNVDYAQGFGLCRPIDRERLLHAEHGMSLVHDPQVVEVLSHFGPNSRKRSGITRRRSILSV